MMPERNNEISKVDELIKSIEWKFASKILSATETIAQTDNCYPVLITSFKCTPDAFVIEYFKEILDSHQKPYLILQLDEHDSTVGYETRIEAAIRSFRNHRERQRSEMKEFSELVQIIEDPEKQMPESIFSGAKHLKDKTLLLPSWDPYVGPLLEAVLQNSGVDARLAVNSEDSIRRSLSLNTGQCLPLNIIVQNAIDYIEANKLDPAKTVLWIMKSDLSCNLSMFPHFMKKLLEIYGKGMEQVSVYRGDAVFYDVSLATAINSYLAYMFGGYIRKIGCNIRPYETQAGQTDAAIERALKMLYEAFRYGLPKDPVLEKIMIDFESIETERKERPRVAIFGDLYVRDNELMNRDLIKTVEANGGEVITTPYSEYMKIVANLTTKRFIKSGRYSEFMKIKFLKSLIPLVEDKYKKYFYKYNGAVTALSSEETDEWLGRFGLNILQRGESFENILKIQALIKQHPDLDLFIQTNPSYCCPSLVTEAMTSKIEELTGVPVVTIEYDGTAGIKNQDVIPYLKYRKKKAGI